MRISGRTRSLNELVSAAFQVREVGIAIALGVAVGFFALRASHFLTVNNWQNMAQNVAIIVVVGVGETMVFLTRNFDISIGSIVGLSAYLSAEFFTRHTDAPLLAIALLAVGIGLALGVVNGLLVVVAKIPSIVATLATLVIYRGIEFEAASRLSVGQQIVAYQLPERFLNIASSKPAGLPLLAWIALGVALVGAALLHWAPWGRDLYAIGSSPDAARYAGIRSGRRVVGAFAICGALAGLGGFMYTANYPNLSADSATGFEFEVITAVVIGGVGVFGGSGTVIGMVLGAVLVTTIQSGFTLLKISEFWRLFFNGFAIVVAVAISALATQRLQETLRRRRADVLAARHEETAA